MIIKPRIRGYICTTAHPVGCAVNVKHQIDYVREQGELDADGTIRNALVIGSSAGYGLASRIVAAFGCGAATLAVSFEKSPSEKRTGTAGWYNNVAFDEVAAAAGLYAKTLDGDAYSDEMKKRVVDVIKADMGKIDLLVYSLASPVRQHPHTGELHRSVIKPLGSALQMKTVNVDRGEVFQIDLEPADAAETAATVAVMGGEDWEFWIDALQRAGVLAPRFRTLAYTYIGTELTWPIYWEGTLGKAKEDLDRAATAITDELVDLQGQARVAVLKAVVTQAMSAIPVVPLYASLLFKTMKERNVHENPIQHIYRMFATQLCGAEPMNLDEAGRIRMDDVEMSDEIQQEVRRRWGLVSTDNLAELGDLDGFREEFLKIFGFGLSGVDYDADLDPTLGRNG